MINNLYNVQKAVSVGEFHGHYLEFFSALKKGTTIQKAEDMEDEVKEEVEMLGLVQCGRGGEQ